MLMITPQALALHENFDLVDFQLGKRRKPGAVDLIVGLVMGQWMQGWWYGIPDQRREPGTSRGRGSEVEISECTGQVRGRARPQRDVQHVSE